MKKERDFDVIVYGANGYTAEYVIRELEKQNIKVAVAARNDVLIKTRFDKIVSTIEEIKALTERTRILINCVGPYSMHGEPIIKACIESETHYLDICGEPQFLDKIYVKYNHLAEQRNLKIIQACGFDSFPSDFGAFILSQKFKIQNIDVYISLEGSKGNITSWNSLVNSLVEYNNSKRQNKKVESKSNGKKTKECKYLPELSSYVVKFRGSDSYVIKRSMNYFRTHNICFSNVNCYLKIGSLFRTILYYFYMVIIYIFAKSSFTSKLLLKYPGFFTMGIVKSKPSFAEVDGSQFVNYFKISDVKDKFDLIISGRNPGYLSTAVFLTQSAMTLINEENNIPSGVITPAIAFHKTDIVGNLMKSGIIFKFS